MSRNVRVVLLCEDKQHEVFVRRFLKADGWIVRNLTPVVSPAGRGSAEQFVRERFPRELKELRSRGGERVYLVVMVDGDASGVSARRLSLRKACIEQGVAPPQDSDNVLICVPTWNIETWLAYLGGDSVDESRKDYPRLTREGDCMPMVNTLVGMCRKRTLRKPIPASLEDACTCYRTVFG